MWGESSQRFSAVVPFHCGCAGQRPAQQIGRQLRGELDQCLTAAEYILDCDCGIQRPDKGVGLLIGR